MAHEGEPVDLVVDVANVMGSRPDGWWRDRAGAAARTIRSLSVLPGRTLRSPSRPQASGDVRVVRVIAVVEGRARAVADLDGVTVVRAPADGDSAIVETCRTVVAQGRIPLVVTADRGLRARVPEGSVIAGPQWLLGELEID